MCTECNTFIRIIDGYYSGDASDEGKGSKSHFVFQTRQTCPEAAAAAIDQKKPELTTFSHIHRLLDATSDEKFEERKPRVLGDLNRARANLRIIVESMENGTYTA